MDCLSSTPDEQMGEELTAAAMDDTSQINLNDRKAHFRRLGTIARAELVTRDDANRIVLARVLESEAFGNATTVMCYVSFRNEVDTQDILRNTLKSGKSLVVPFCDGDELGLFRMESLNDLAPGTLGIPEPGMNLRCAPDRLVQASALDLILVPGVAFDRKGGRVGFGKGYYDRLLARVRGDAIKIGLAFECQMFDTVPMGQHDVQMDLIVTESAIYG